jgi:D-3-phosphoglycerate dehydrogenase
VEIRDIEIDAQLGPYMLYVRNDDRPGLIGGLGSALGDAGVNIATFHLGRQERGSDAIALIAIDEAVTPEVLAKVEQLPHVRQAKPLNFPAA